MNLIFLTPGAGSMYCGNCLRDNALAAALRRLGHQVTMIPLYLPLTLDEPDQSAGTPVFFGGVNVFLDQKLAWYRSAPAWLHRLMNRGALLRLAAGRAARTRPEDAGDLTLSMLRGEQGNQERELRDLIGWLQTQPKPDLVCLSNVLLIGMARQLRSELRIPVVCHLQGEDAFLDALPEEVREESWKLISRRAGDVHCFIAPSRYFAEKMSSRLNLENVRVIANGIALEGYPRELKRDEPPTSAPVIGFFARMCREKGLELLVEAFIRLHHRGRVPGLRLKIGGSCSRADELFVRTLRDRLVAAKLPHAVEFAPNLSREQKIEFLKSLTVFSVPAVYGEAFGLYVIEALAAGVPVVQPRTAAFPELLHATGGGVLCEPASAEALAASLEELLLNRDLQVNLSRAGHAAVWREFGADAMAERMESVFRDLASYAKTVA